MWTAHARDLRSLAESARARALGALSSQREAVEPALLSSRLVLLCLFFFFFMEIFQQSHFQRTMMSKNADVKINANEITKL